jgi:cell division protein FtsB
MVTKEDGLMMNRDNISALVMVISVVVLSVIVGFTIYFNNASLNQAWSVQQQEQQQQQQKDKGMVVVAGGVHSAPAP